MVYITSHLFGSEPIYDSPTAPPTIHPQAWNMMADTQLAPGLGKRKRRADGDEEGSKPTGCSPQQRSSPTSKGLLRFHGHAPAFDTNNNRMYPVTVATSTPPTPERRPVKQMRRMLPKVALVKSTSHLMDIELDPAPSSTATNHSDLRPCHACNTAPKRKRDLENYMECRRCDERTCYICARECVECHKAICNKCIVEVGEDGDPWCLKCYSKRLNS